MSEKSLLAAEVAMTPAAAELHSAESTLAPGHDCPLDLSIFVSCYNEAPYVVRTLDTLRSALAELHFSYEIIVIDDCSRDGSADLVADYIRANPTERILLRRNKLNIGFAQNYIDGAFIGRGKYYRIICGDASEPKETMIKVFREIGSADIIIPYYVVNENRSWYRGFLSSAYVSLVNLVSGFRLKYYNGLPVHLRYNVMRWHSNTRGFGFQADILCLLLEQGFSFKEVPVYAIELKGGKSTALTFKNVLSIAHTLFDIGIRRIANKIYGR
ncbi:MAG TPA: glycosyltransferase [Xanthobacteraceae bacterium]|nr:glycosyltransferase [Xanthobacteraceae bacterium]